MEYSFKHKELQYELYLQFQCLNKVNNSFKLKLNKQTSHLTEIKH